MAYDAFISYSHAADGRLAPSLQRGLQRLSKPWYQRRALRIFRDQTNLSASPSLWTSIVEALDNAGHFLFLASPEAAASEWVRKEIAHWLSSNPPETILIALTGGEIAWDLGRGDFDRIRTNAVPDELRGVFKDEPLHVDLRWVHDETQLNLAHPGFLNAVADLAAPIHGRDKDELVGEDIRQHKRAKLTAWTGGLLVASLAVAAGVAAYQASVEREQKEQQRKVAQAGRLAAESRFALDEGRYDLGLLLGVEANRLAVPGADSMTRTAPFRALYRAPQLAKYLHLDSPAIDVAYSPDGKELAVLLTDGRIALWNVQTAKVARYLDVPPLSLPSRRTAATDGRLHFSDDGRSLALLEPARLLAWDLGGGAIVTEVRAPQIEVEKSGEDFLGPAVGRQKIIDAFDVIAVSEGHRFAATVHNKVLGLLRGHDATQVQVWDLGSEVTEPYDIHQDARVTAFTFSGDSQLLIGDENGRVSIIDLAGRAPAGDPIETGRGIDHLAVDESGFFGRERTIVAVSNAVTHSLGFPSKQSRNRETEITLWDWDSRESKAVDWRIGETQVAGLATLKGLLVTQSDQGGIRFWDIDRERAFDRTLSGNPEGSRAFTLSQKDITPEFLAQDFSRSFGGWNESSLASLLIATIDRDGTVMLFDMLGRAPGGTVHTALSGLDKGFGLSADGGVAVISTGGELQFRDLEKDLTLATVTGADDLRGVLGLGIHPRPVGAVTDGRKMAFLVDGGLSIVRADGPTVRLKTEADLTAMAWHPDGRSIAAGGRDGVVTIWDAGDGSFTATLPAAEEGIRALAFSPDGQLLAIASEGADGHSLRVWDTVRGTQLTEIPIDQVKGIPRTHRARIFSGRNNAVSDIRFGPDGRRLAIHFLDGTLLLWSLETRRPIAPPVRSNTGDLILYEAMAFSPDGGLLAVASGSKQVSLSLIDVNTGRAIGGPLWQGEQAIVDLAFSTDGSTLRALTQSGNLMAWDIAGPVWHETACRVANRNLSCGEWERFFGDEPYRKTCPALDAPNDC